MPTVEVEGQLFEFPDGTDDKTIGVAIRNHFAQQEQQAGAAEAGFQAGTEVGASVESEAQTLQRLQRGELSNEERAQLSFTPEGLSRKIEGGTEALRAILSGIVAEPVAGLAGAGAAINPFIEAPAEGMIEKAREQLTITPETEEGKRIVAGLGEALKPVADALEATRDFFGGAAFEATGSPAIAAAAATAPEAALELLGAGLGKRAVTGAAQSTARAQKAVDSLTDIQAGKVTDAGVQDVVDVVKRGTADELAAVVDADPNFYRAADELGLSTEPLAGFASRNPQFRDVEAALRKVPGSVLDPQARAFIEETSRAADDIIQQYGGTIDKAQLGLDFKAESLAKVDDLAQQADDAYGLLRNTIPEASRFEAPKTVEFLNSLKAKESIPPRLNRILKDLEPKEVSVGRATIDPATGAVVAAQKEIRPPTLAKIDQVRRDIGQAINKGSGPFKDVEQGLNKAVYARLTADQDEIARLAGASEISDAAKGLVRQRKQIEDNLQSLLGKDLNQALNVTVSGAIKNLTKGQVDKFNEVIRAIPKSRRQEAVLSAMNDVFKGTGVGQQSLNPTQFVKWYETMRRSKSAFNALRRELPKDSLQAIDNLYEVSRGISRSLGQTTPTGRINALFNPETGIIRKMAQRAVTPVVAAATGSPTASAATNVTMDFLRQATDGAKAASDLMGSPQFQNIVRQSVKEGVSEGGAISEKLVRAEAALAKTKRYKAWVDTLAKPDRAALEAGLVSYLFREQEQNQEQR